MELKKAFSVGLPLCMLLVSGVQQAGAQEGFTTKRTVIESSSSSPKGSGGSAVAEESGVMGVQSANKQVYKYPKSVVAYREQIELLQRKGLLAPSKADEFRERLAELDQLTRNAAAKEWPTDLVADLDKKFTKFNADLTTTSTTPEIKAVEKPKPGKKLQQARPMPKAIAPEDSFVGDSNEGSKEMRKVERRPNVGGGDSKPQGAAGRSN